MKRAQHNIRQMRADVDRLARGRYPTVGKGILKTAIVTMLEAHGEKLKLTLTPVRIGERIGFRDLWFDPTVNRLRPVPLFRVFRKLTANDQNHFRFTDLCEWPDPCADSVSGG